MYHVLLENLCIFKIFSYVIVMAMSAKLNCALLRIGHHWKFIHKMFRNETFYKLLHLKNINKKL